MITVLIKKAVSNLVRLLTIPTGFHRIMPFGVLHVEADKHPLLEEEKVEHISNENTVENPEITSTLKVESSVPDTESKMADIQTTQQPEALPVVEEKTEPTIEVTVVPVRKTRNKQPKNTDVDLHENESTDAKQKKARRATKTKPQNKK